MLRHRGIPASSIISIRAGGTRRQAQLSALDRPFKFPCRPEECTTFKVDALDLLGSARLAYNPDENEYCLPLEPTEGGSQASMEVSFRIKRAGAAGSHGAGEAEEDRSKDQRKEGAARDYLEKHGLTAFMQFLMQSLMKDKPPEPYTFLQREVTKRMVTEITKNAEDPGLESLIAKLSSQGPQGVSAEQYSNLEHEAAAVGEQLRTDNARLRETAEQLMSRYGQLLDESALLHRAAASKGPSGAASVAPTEAMAESSASMQVAAYKDIAKMQDEVTVLAKENALLVSELARMLSSIDTVRGEIDSIHQSRPPSA